MEEVFAPSGVSLNFHRVVRMERRVSPCDPNWFTLYFISEANGKLMETEIAVFADRPVVETTRE
jgi:hypothetical protein